MMTSIVFPLILFSVLLNAAAQLLLKSGVGKIGLFDFTTNNILPIFCKVATSPCIIGGLFLYLGSVAVWLLVLSRADVSLAYPMTSLGYIVTAIAAFFLLHENVSLVRIVGIIVIIAGVYLVARS